MSQHYTLSTAKDDHYKCLPLPVPSLLWSDLCKVQAITKAAVTNLHWARANSACEIPVKTMFSGVLRCGQI